MASDQERVLVAPCGIYCGACRRYKASTDKALRKQIAEQTGVPVEEVYVCAGCWPMQGRVKMSGAEPTCETYACAVENKKVEFCYQCDDFPCLKLAPCLDWAPRSPHNTKIYSLLLLQKLGIDALVEKYPTILKQYRQGKKPKLGGDIQL
jgi:hypothetical protein